MWTRRSKFVILLKHSMHSATGTTIRCKKTVFLQSYIVSSIHIQGTPVVVTTSQSTRRCGQKSSFTLRLNSATSRDINLLGEHGPVDRSLHSTTELSNIQRYQPSQWTTACAHLNPILYQTSNPNHTSSLWIDNISGRKTWRIWRLH
jgi:hypothetical protein